MKRGFGWKKGDKYSHAKWISDTLFLLRNCDSSMMRGKDVVEVVETALVALKVALIERGQVCVKGIGTILVDTSEGAPRYLFVPTSTLQKEVMSCLLSGQSSSVSQPSQHGCSPSE